MPDSHVPIDAAIDDFIEDCFIEEDPICKNRREESLELVASRLIAELVSDDDEDLIAA